LKRTPLRRSGWIRRKPSRRVIRKTDADRAFTAWIHTQPCVGLRLRGHRCIGRIEQSHERNMTGLGLKASDLRSVPMCGSLHRNWEGHTGPFAGWSKERRRVWFAERIIEQHARYAVDTGTEVAA
jgi:hypothetical protein